MPSSLSLVVAYSRITRTIGCRSNLPWPRLPTDLARFKRLTSYHTVIMGRKTFESPEVNSLPLQNRRNIVLSSHPRWTPPAGVVHASDWDEAILLAHAGFGGAGYDDGNRVVTPPHTAPPDHVFIVGGEHVYKQALNHGSQWVFATEIDHVFQGDAFFPQLDHTWTRVSPCDCPKDWASDSPVHENGLTYSFVTYHRPSI